MYFSGNITPTVELNALAMKRGEPAIYSFIEPPHNGNPHNMYIPPPNHNFNYRGIYNQVSYDEIYVNIFCLILCFLITEVCKNCFVAFQYQ